MDEATLLLPVALKRETQRIFRSPKTAIKKTEVPFLDKQGARPTSRGSFSRDFDSRFKAQTHLRKEVGRAEQTGRERRQGLSKGPNSLAENRASGKIMCQLPHSAASAGNTPMARNASLPPAGAGKSAGGKQMLSKAQRQIIMSIRWAFGFIFSVNFLVFWALPIGIQVTQPSGPTVPLGEIEIQLSGWECRRPNADAARPNLR